VNSPVQHRIYNEKCKRPNKCILYIIVSKAGASALDLRDGEKLMKTYYKLPMLVFMLLSLLTLMVSVVYAGQILITVDSAGWVGSDTSLKLGQDGFPVISYYDATNGDLKIAVCNDPNCITKTLTKVDSTGDVGKYTSLVLNGAGNPVISYLDVANGDLKVAVCSNTTCTAKTITTVDSADDVGYYTSLQLNGDNPVISYYDNTNGDLKVAVCGNATCTAKTITTVDSADDVGRYTSLALNGAGNPVISYYDNTNGGLKLAICEDTTCASTVVDSDENVGFFTSLELNGDNPVISYYDNTNGDLKVALCGDAACTAKTITIVDDAGIVGQYTSLKLNGGNPVISYTDLGPKGINVFLKVAECDATCTSPTFIMVDNTGQAGQFTSLALNSENTPVISYLDVAHFDLKVAVIDELPPTVTINQADLSEQPDPTNTSPIKFIVVFSEPVTDFGAADIMLSGDAGATGVAVTAVDSTTYNVAVSGMKNPGAVVADVKANAARDLAGNYNNLASTSTDNTVLYEGTITTLTVGTAVGTYGGTTSLTATLKAGGTSLSGKTINFAFNNGTTIIPVGSAVTNTNGIANFSPANLAGIDANTYLNGVVATFAGAGTYAASNGKGDLTVDKAASTVTVTCPETEQPYTGSQIEPCSASYSGAGGLSGTLIPTYSSNVNMGTATAEATYDGDANHEADSGSATFVIGKATSTVTVTCPVEVQTYTGSAIEPPCEATYSTSDGLSDSLTPAYSNNVNAGTATASASYAEDADHKAGTGSATFKIVATSTVTVTCPVNVTYTGSAIKPCTASYLTTDGLNGPLTPTYLNNVDAGTATANASYAGDPYHDGSIGSDTFDITPASTTTVVTCPTAEQPYTGSAIEPCTVSVTGANLSLTPPPVYADNVNVGTASASYTYTGDANHTGSNGSATFEIGKATSTVTVTCPASETYTGLEIKPCTTTYLTTDGSNGLLTPTYSNNVNAGTATANASYAGDADHIGSSGSDTFNIIPASTTTIVTCPASETYTGLAITPCTVSVTGANLSLSPNPVYADNVNVGTASASYTYTGDANHTSSGGSDTFEITPASTTTVVTCPASETYTGLAITPCTVSVTGANLSLTPAPSYANNVNVGTASASYTYTGDVNHTGSSGSDTFEIDKATSTVTVICPASATYTGSVIEPCIAAYSTSDGLSGPLTSTYSNNVNTGTATASASYAGDASHEVSSNSATFKIVATSTVTVTCPLAAQTYTGSPIEPPCTASYLTTDGQSGLLTPTYSNNVNVGTTATANASYAGDPYHDGSNGSDTFDITPALTITIVTCPTAEQPYTGTEIRPCTVLVTGANLSLTPDPAYADNVNVGTASASYTYIPDTNHTGSSDSDTFTIGKATSTVTVTCPASETYTGSAIEPPCAATYLTTDGSGGSLPLTYSDNVNAGTATASATYDGDADHIGSSGSDTFEISKATPVITWENPADILYGTPLSGTQLNATASLDGEFTYTPATGTRLNTGLGQALSVNFKPVNTNYTEASKTVIINVNQAPPTLLSPAKGTVLSIKRPTFRWSSVGGSTSYTIQISTVSNFTTITRSATITTTSYMLTSDLAAKTRYYWRVNSTGDSGISAWSAVFYFTTGNPPSVPVLASPANGASVSPAAQLFNWNNSTVPAGITFSHYTIQIARDSGFTSIFQTANISGITNSQFTSAPLVTGTTYYWRVRSLGTAPMSYSSWSTVRSVLVKFTAPTLLSPPNVLTPAVGDTTPTFKWRAVHGATSYTIQYARNSTFTLGLISTTVASTSTSYTPATPLSSGTTYYWRVRVNGAYTPVFSSVWRFKP
jgi:hypothetical protein